MAALSVGMDQVLSMDTAAPGNTIRKKNKKRGIKSFPSSSYDKGVEIIEIPEIIVLLAE